MKFRSIYSNKKSLHLLHIGLLLILKSTLVISSYSDSGEEQEEQFVDAEEDDNFLTSLENSVPGSTVNQQQSHILINVKHIVDFIHAMKKSQDVMFRKIETLAKSVEFTDKQKNWEFKLSALENRVQDLERAQNTPKRTQFDFGLHSTQQELLPHQRQQQSSTTTRSPSTYFYHSTPDPISSASRLIQPRSLNSTAPDGFQIEQPFTPRPLYTAPTIPTRNSRSRNTVPSGFFKVGGTMSRSSNLRIFSPPPVPSLYSTGGEGHHNRSNEAQITTMSTNRELTNLSGEEITQPTWPTSSIRSSNEGQNIEAVLKKVRNLERSVLELQQNVSYSSYSNSYANSQTSNPSSGIEISEIKEKQGQLKRAVDTVMISFSGIFRTLEEVEEKLETCCDGGQRKEVANSNHNLNLTTPTPTPTTTTHRTTIPSTTRPPFSFPWGSNRPPFVGQTHRDREMIHQHQSFGFEDNATSMTTSTSTMSTTTTGTTMATNFADYGRETHNDYNVDDWDSDRSSDHDNSWSDHVSAEREEPDPEPIDFATYAFLKRPIQGRKLATKSLRAMQSDEGQSRVSRDFSILSRRMQNLTKQVGHQKKQINTLSTELARVNVSHFLLLRTMDDDIVKRSIRPRDCSEIQLLLQLQTDHNKSRKIAKNAKNVTHHNKKAERIGKYTIFPKQNDDPVQVICDLDPNSDGGGWTIIQRRGTPLLNESERTNFYRGWKDYEQGFGNVDGDYWIGLSNIANLTRLDDQELRIELTKWDGSKGVASYGHFKVYPSTSLFRLNVSDYSGNVGDSLARHNGMAFSTFDNDNDADTRRNCALEWKGAWWYYGCHESNLNGLYAASNGKNGTHEFGTGIVWETWTTNYYSLKEISMKIRTRWRRY